MDEEGRAGLAMSVLQRLFAREGESALEEMLEAVLDGEAEGHSGKDSWCKVIRVPFSCHQEATPARKAASTGVSTRRASVTFAPGSSGGLESGGVEWSGAPETQTTARGALAVSGDTPADCSFRLLAPCLAAVGCGGRFSCSPLPSLPNAYERTSFFLSRLALRLHCAAPCQGALAQGHRLCATLHAALPGYAGVLWTSRLSKQCAS